MEKSYDNIKAFERIEYRKEFKSIYKVDKFYLSSFFFTYLELAQNHKFDAAAKIREEIFIVYLN